MTHEKLPEGWASAPLSEVADINPGSYSKPPQDHDLVSFVPMAAVEEESGRLDPSTHRPWLEVKKGYTLFQNDDVLFAKVTPCMENGKAALATRLKGGRGAGSTEFFVLRSRGGVDPKYLMHFVLQSSFRRAARAAMQGVAGLLRVRKEFMETAQVPVAPLHEQRRIVAEIERQFTRLDAGVENLKRVQAQLKRHRVSVLKAACEGRLVPTEAELARREKRNYEPADKLLARILKERRARWEAGQLAKMKASGKLPKDDKWKTKYVEPVAPETSGLPSLQIGWTWSTIDQLSSVVTKGSSPNWQGFDYCASGVLFVRSQNIGWGSLQLDERVFLPHAFNEKESRSVLANGDVLLNIVGASIGRAALATTELAGANINQAVALIRPVVPSIGAYVLRYLLSPIAQQYIHREKVDVARANLSLADVSEMPVPLPPLSEQQRIIFEAESRLSVGDAVELALMSTETRAARLRQAVLKTAFEGSLVPQDPRDEPASKLLKHISAAVENKTLPKQSRARQTTAVSKTKATR
jgi:type I restriction enzyme, S subunit